MGIIIRQSIKASLVSYVGVLIGAFNVLWLFPKYLSKEEIGLINLIESSALLFVAIASGSVQVWGDKFFPKFNNKAQKHQGFLALVLMYFMVSFAVFSIFYFIFQNQWEDYYRKKSPSVLPYYFLILGFTFINALILLFENYSKQHLRIVVPTFLREVSLKILISGSIILYAFAWIGIFELIVLRILFYSFVLLILIAYLVNLKVFFLQPNFKFLTPTLLKDIFKFILYAYPAVVSVLVLVQIDKLFIGAMLGLDALGVYSIAFFVGTILEIPRRMLSSISSPVIAQAWENNDLIKIKTLYKQSCLNQLILGGLLFLLIWLNIDDLFALMPNGEKFLAGKYVLLFIALTRIVDMATGLNSEILAYSPYYRFQLIGVVFLSLLILALNLILIPIYGIVGAALALLLSYLLYNAIKFFFLWYKLDFQPFDYKTIVTLSIGIGIYLLSFSWINFDWIILNVFIKVFLISILYTTTFYYLNLSEELTQAFDWISKILGLKRTRQ